MMCIYDIVAYFINQSIKKNRFYLNLSVRDVLDLVSGSDVLHSRSRWLCARGGFRLVSERFSQSSGRRDVVSVSDFGLLVPGRGGGGVGLLAEERRGEINGNDREKDRGQDDSRVQIHDGHFLMVYTCLAAGRPVCVNQPAVTHTLSSCTPLCTI